LHGNLVPEIAALLDFAAGYKTHPPIDQRPTALRVIGVLAPCVAVAARSRHAPRSLYPLSG